MHRKGITMNNVMIDIETLGTSADSVILSIAAVEFSREHGDLGRQFHAKLDPCGQNRRVCTETLKWWAKQPQGAFEDAMSSDVQLWMGLTGLVKFVPIDAIVWSQGSDFDFKILDNAYDQTRLTKPWKYNAKRDTRTLYDVANFDTRTIEREGVAHNALDDCKHQIRCVVAAFNKLKGIAN